MEVKKSRKIVFKTCIIAMLLSLTACKSNGNGEVAKTDSPSNKTTEGKETIDKDISSLEEPDLPQYETYLECIKKEDKEDSFKLLKQDKEKYIKKYENEDEFIDDLLSYLNDWDVAGFVTIGASEEVDLESRLSSYNDSIQEEWNKIKGSVTCKKTGKTFSQYFGNIIEYEFTFDMQESGILNLNKGKNTKYYYLSVDKIDTTTSVHGIPYFKDESERISNSNDAYENQYKPNFGLSTNDDWYYEKMKEDNFVLHMEYDRDYKVDLDGDGKEEVLSMNLSQDSKDLGTEKEPFIYTYGVHNIIVDGKKQDHLKLHSGEYSDGSYDDSFYLVDIDSTDKYIEIAIDFCEFGGGSYVEPDIVFYRYIDGKVTPIGSVPAGEKGIGFHSDGIIEQGKDLDDFSFIDGKCKYIYSKSNKTIEQKSKWCYYSEECKTPFLETYEAYELPEDNAKVVSINKGDEVTFLATNLNGWYWCEKSDGTKFFMKYSEYAFVNNNSEKTTYSLYELIEYLDD